MLWQKLMGTFSAASGIEYVGGYVLGFTGQTTDRTVTLTSLTGGIASAPSAGDLVIVCFGTGSSANTALAVAGYTEVQEVYANDSADTNFVVAYKFMGGTPDTSVILAGGTQSTSDAGAVYVAVWRGVDTTVDVRYRIGTALNTVRPNPLPITPDTDGSIVLVAGAGGHTAGAQTFSSSELTDFQSEGRNDTFDATIGGGYIEWTSGAFDPAQFTFSTTDSTGYSNASATLTLVPEQNATTPPTFIASAKTSNETLGTTLVIAKPTGTAEGDLMVAFMGASNDATWTGDTDWTEVVDEGVEPSLRVAYKIAGASEPADYTFTCSVSSHRAGTILTFRNAAYETASSVTTVTTETSVSTPSVSTGYNILIGFITDENSGEHTELPTMEIPTLNTQTSASRMRWVVGTETVAAGQYNRFFSYAVDDQNATSAVLVVIKPA